MMLKLFNLEVKDNDPMILSTNVRAFMHKIQTISMQLDLPLVSFIRSLYPTHSHYLESLQASDKLKDLTFNTLVEKTVDTEKAFGKKINDPSGEPF